MLGQQSYSDEKSAAHLIRLMGISLMIVGLTAMILPQFFTIAIEKVAGMVLLVGGALSGAHVMQLRSRSDFWWRLVGSLAALIAGVVLLTVPLAGAATLTIIVGVYLLTTGVNKTSIAISLRHRDAWGWLLVGGVVDLALGLFILLQWQSVSAWLIGLVVGISLFLNGLWLTFLSSASR